MEGTGIHPYHQQWPPARAPPPPSVPYYQTPPTYMENPNRNPSDEVRTIFISGLPEDVKERELQNFLRWLPGYEASEVNSKGERPMGFALFSTPQFAIAAKEALRESVFDAESKSVLHTEMAKKNLFVKRGIVGDSNTYDQSKRMRTGGDYTHSVYSIPYPSHPPAAPVCGHHGYMAPPPPYAFAPPPPPYAAAPPPYAAAPPPYAAAPPPPYDPYIGYPVPPVPMPVPAQVPAPSNYVPVQNIKDNPPCNTLFIGNLGKNVNEDELRGVFIMQPGFKQMKVLRQERHTVCFIEFEDVNSATNVHHTMQGAVVPSSGFVGMRIQYSKNPFGKRKDSNHPASAVRTNGVPPPLTY